MDAPAVEKPVKHTLSKWPKWSTPEMGQTEVLCHVTGWREPGTSVPSLPEVHNLARAREPEAEASPTSCGTLCAHQLP